MGQAGHKVGDPRSSINVRRRRTHEHSSVFQVGVNRSTILNKNGKIVPTQDKNSDDEKPSAEEDLSSSVGVSSYEDEQCENHGGHEPTIAPEEGNSSLSVDGLRHAWFDSARSEVTLEADCEKGAPTTTKTSGEEHFQEIWSTNVDFSPVRCSFALASVGDDACLEESILSDDDKKEIVDEQSRIGDEERDIEDACWVMEFRQKDAEEAGVSGCWDTSKVPTSDDFASGTADEKNCYFQFVEGDDDFQGLPTMCFEDDDEKKSVGSCAEISFTNKVERDGSPFGEEIKEFGKEDYNCETARESSLDEKRLEKPDQQRIIHNVDDGIESLDSSSLDTEGSIEVGTASRGPANSMVKRVCSTVKRMDFFSVFMRQWSRDVQKTAAEECDDVEQRQKKKTFINPSEVLGSSPPSAGTFNMKSLVSTVLSEARSVEQDVHPYGRGNMYTNAFAGKRSLVQLDPAKLMFWGIVVCMVTGAAFGVIILSELHRGQLRRLLQRYNGSFPDWY